MRSLYSGSGCTGDSSSDNDGKVLHSSVGDGVVDLDDVGVIRDGVDSSLSKSVSKENNPVSKGGGRDDVVCARFSGGNE